MKNCHQPITLRRRCADADAAKPIVSTATGMQIATTLFHTVARRWRAVALSASLMIIGSAQADDHDQGIAEGTDVIPAHLASESLLLDIITANDGRLIAVGGRGHILVSDDQGENWRQVLEVPTRTTLTSAVSAGNRVWAVGHDTTIIASEDNGETWNIQFDDIGGDPLMDIIFDNDGNGIAVGAYGLFMTTEDNGADWQQDIMADLLIRDETVDEQEEAIDEDAELDDSGFLDQSEIADFEDLDVEYHLNSLLRLDNERLVIAAEAGRGYYSDDNGENWRLFRLPYDGSMFGIVSAGQDGCVITFGLRGNVLQTCDIMGEWQLLDSGVNASMFDGTYDGVGSLWLVGANGTLLQRPAGGELRSIKLDTGDDFNGLVFVSERMILIGETGLLSMQPPE